MTSVANAIREKQREEVRRLTVSQRLALAFRLGDDDVSLFAAAEGIGRSRAEALLRRARRGMRRPSRCLDEPV